MDTKNKPKSEIRVDAGGKVQVVGSSELKGLKMLMRPDCSANNGVCANVGHCGG